MKTWIEILMPLLVAVVPIIVTVITTARTTRLSAKSNIRALENKLDAHINASAEANAKAKRVRILRFADDICKGVLFTKEYWSDVLDDINDYTMYCEENRENFRNAKCDIAMSYIKEEYAKALRTNNFMGVE